MTTGKHRPIMDLNEVSEEKKGIATHSGVKLRCAEQAINSGAFWNYINTRARVCGFVGWGQKRGGGS
jgi:hypothetical protein